MTRSLPARPSLRYLKLEAKRRLATGEFHSLHQAQAAIAREHGFANWAALKEAVGRQPPRDSHALAQLGWIIDRFRNADQPSWAAPDTDELRLHFTDQVLEATRADDLVAGIVALAGQFREDPVLLEQSGQSARARIGGLEVFIAVEADPPHRIAGLQSAVLGSRVTDARVAAPAPVHTLGAVPAGMAKIADDAVVELGLAGLAIAGGHPQGMVWAVTRGWADLERPKVLDPNDRFPALGIAVLVTATAVLRLVADDRLGLDTPVNEHLHTVRLADGSVTVRELLSHTGGVDSPAPADMFGDRLPDLLSLMGPVIGCGGPRGVVQPSNGGYAVLGQLVADVTGLSYVDAVTRLVLQPLGLAASFPTRTGELGPDKVAGYALTSEGAFAPVEAMICTVAAVGGLWATPANLVRLGLGWSSLLPEALVREALTPQSPPGPGGRTVGLGWLIDSGAETAIHAGAGPGASACLALRSRDRQVRLALTNRWIPLDHVIDRILAA